MPKRELNKIEKNMIVDNHKAKDHALLRSIAEGVIATDKQEKIILFNRQAEIMFGITEKSALGKPFSEIINLEDENGIFLLPENRPVTLAFQTGKEVVDNKHYYSTVAIKRFSVSIIASPVFIEKKIAGVVTIIRNIEHEREVDRAKSEFVSLVSHQLRTPLTAIKIFVEMLESGGLGKLSAEQLDVINNIGQSNEKMIEIVDTLLNVSRMETGRFKIEYKKFSIKDFIREVVSETQALADSRNCKIVFDFPKAEFNVWSDPILLRQVLNNLIINALYYSPTGTEIKICCKKETDNKCLISVEDSGMGIPKDEHEKIFERFYRAGNAVRMKTEGNGLGLYMCRMIINGIGGNISVESEPNDGAKFSIIFPTDGRSSKDKTNKDKTKIHD